MTTVIRNAAWIAAWDENAGRHMYLQNGVLCRCLSCRWPFSYCANR